MAYDKINDKFSFLLRVEEKQEGKEKKGRRGRKRNKE